MNKKEKSGENTMGKNGEKRGEKINVKRADLAINPLTY